MKRSRLYTAVAMLGLTVPMTAGAYVFDPDGNGVETSVIMTAFDWAPSNVLVAGGNQAVQNFLLNLGDMGNRDVSFKVWAQAQLFGTTGQNINNNCTPGQSVCAGGNYEITYSFGFTEQVTNVILSSGGPGINTAFFAYVDDNTSFYQMFQDPSTNSNNLTGAGFDDGTMILSSRITPLSTAFGNFTSTGQGGGLPFDATADGDQYFPIKTLDSGSTGSNSDILIDFALLAPLFADPLYFRQPIADLRFNNQSLSPQFTSVNPSGQFDGLANPVGNPSATNAAVIPNLGTINGGLPIPPSGPDIQLQTDTNTPITAAIPEPGTLALLGLGMLAGIGFRGRRRKD